jgi:hypothetical protein
MPGVLRPVSTHTRLVARQSEPTGEVVDMREGFDPQSCRVALQSRLGIAYNEKAFRYFLALERKRSARSGHTSLVLLVDFRRLKRAGTQINSAVIAKVFPCLWISLRQTDFVGWYREERVAGAVLTGPVPPAGPGTSEAVTARINAVLRKNLRPDLAGHLHVRVYQIGPTRKG